MSSTTVVDLAGALQRLAALDQHAELGAPPVATITAVGTASPIAHGQAMISTATAAANARTERRRSAGDEPDDERQRRDRHHDRHEHRAHAIGELLDRRARRLRVAHQPDDLRERAVGADRRSRGHRSAPVRLIVPPITRSPAPLAHRHRLAGEHRLVDRGRAVDDLAVDRDALAGPHEDEVAGRAPASIGDAPLARSPSTTVRASAAAVRRARRSAADGLPLRARLERAAGEDERDDDDHRLVVDVRQSRRRAMKSAGQTRRDERIHERRAGADGDQRVHVRHAVAQRPERR